MGLEDIKAKVLSDARAEADQIKAQAQQQAQAITAQHDLEAQAEIKKILDEAARKAEHVERSILIPARLAYKSALLTVKHAMLDEVFKDKPQKREEKELEVIKILYGE